MKKLALVLSSLLVLTLTTTAFAQEDNNRDENGKIVRGPYEKAGAAANWFVSLGGGVNWTADGILSHNLCHDFGPALDVMFGKWFSPNLGFRVGYQGLTSGIEGTVKKEDIDNRFPFVYTHADLLWNFSNTVWGYKESRIYNAVPYGHIGALVANGNNLCGGVGLLNNFRVAKHWTIYADLRGILVGGDHFIEDMKGVAGNLSLTAGVTWNIGKTGWKRASTADADDAAAALAEAEKAQQAAAEEEAKEEEPAPAAEEPAKVEEPAEVEETPVAEEPAGEADEAQTKEKQPNVFYFTIGQSMISLDEAARVKEFVKNADKSKKYIVLGYADKETGSQEFNENLAYKRALNVGFLFIKYGIPADNVRADIGGVISTEDPTESRVVVAKEL